MDKSAKSKLDKMRPKYLMDNHLDEVSSLHVSNKYNLCKPVLDECEIHFIEKLDDCVKIVQSITESTKVRFITNESLSGMMFEMMIGGTNTYTPEPHFGGGKILSLGFKVGDVKAVIENTDITSPTDTIVHIKDKDTYMEFHKANDEFYNKYFVNI